MTLYSATALKQTTMLNAFSMRLDFLHQKYKYPDRCGPQDEENTEMMGYNDTNWARSSVEKRITIT